MNEVFSQLLRNFFSNFDFCYLISDFLGKMFQILQISSLVLLLPLFQLGLQSKLNQPLQLLEKAYSFLSFPQIILLQTLDFQANDHLKNIDVFQEVYQFLLRHHRLVGCKMIYHFDKMHLYSKNHSDVDILLLQQLNLERDIFLSLSNLFSEMALQLMFYVKKHTFFVVFYF